MKRVRNRRVVHPCGRIEWILTRTVTVGGVEQELCLIVSIDRMERLLSRRNAVRRIAMTRRTLHYHTNRLQALDLQFVSAQD